MSASEPEANDVERPQDQGPKTAADPAKRDAGPGKSDLLALGIGCLVFCIFFVAIVVVSIMRD